MMVVTKFPKGCINAKEVFARNLDPPSARRPVLPLALSPRHPRAGNGIPAIQPCNGNLRHLQKTQRVRKSACEGWKRCVDFDSHHPPCRLPRRSNGSTGKFIHQQVFWRNCRLCLRIGGEFCSRILGQKWSGKVERIRLECRQ